MKIVRYEYGEDSGFGILSEGMVSKIEGSLDRGLYESEKSFPVDDCALNAPVIPTKVVAVGLNYRDHAEELDMEIPDHPVIFIKVPNTVVGPGERVQYPPQSKRVDYEAELGVVIGRTAYKVAEEEAPDYVLGYTCALDMTARDLQYEDGQWSRAKNFDTFCPLGPWIETELDPDDLAVELRLNGELRQSSRTSQMIFKPSYLLSFISNIMTLHPGDVIITGTPPGVGEVHPGDALEVDIEGIGTLKTTITT